MKKNSRRMAGKILLVDDEPSILELLREILAPEGYDLSTASNGAIALAMIKERDYDLIISDFRMPELSGKELYERARALKPGIESKFILISGELDPITKKAFIKETKVRVIEKPFRGNVVRDVVREALKSRD